MVCFGVCWKKYFVFLSVLQAWVGRRNMFGGVSVVLRYPIDIFALQDRSEEIEKRRTLRLYSHLSRKGFKIKIIRFKNQR